MKRWYFLVGLLMVAIIWPVYEGDAKSYRKTLKQWTVKDAQFRKNDFHASIQWSATLLSDEMFKAQAELYAKTYNSTAEEKAAMLSKLSQKRSDSLLFFVSFYSHDKKFNDLTQADAEWQLRFVAGGSKIKPLRIEKAGRMTPMDKLYYPYVDQWSQAYYVWFPKQAELYTKPWKLTVHSAQGNSELIWK